MHINMLSSKIHRATVTEADLNYVGSITIDKHLLQAAGMREFQLVQVANINTGERFETYTMCGEEHSGIICLNGAAARLAQPGDKVIIMAYAMMTPEEADQHRPRIVLVDDDNQPQAIISG
jgi:aspartate 1-decarboxylase